LDWVVWAEDLVVVVVAAAAVAVAHQTKVDLAIGYVHRAIITTMHQELNVKNVTLPRPTKLSRISPLRHKVANTRVIGIVCLALT